jgi:hypothetical protein
MATTPALTAWTNAGLYDKGYTGGVAANSLDLRIMNAANRRFHLAAPWSWTLGALTATTLVNGTQDYTIASPPSDFLRLQQVRRYDNARFNSNLEVAAALPATTAVGDPSLVTTFDDGALKYRVWPKPTALNASIILGEYKKTTTEITSGNKSTADILLFPDEYYYVYELLVLHYVLKYGNDQRAGTAQFDTSGKIIFTGVLGEAMSAIQELRAQETMSKNADGNPT